MFRCTVKWFRYVYTCVFFFQFLSHFFFFVNLFKKWGILFLELLHPQIQVTLSYEDINISIILSVQFSSVAQLCPTLCNPMNRSTERLSTGLPVHHQLSEFTQTHVHRVGDAIQPSHPLLSPSPPAPNPSQQQGLFKWVSSPHQVTKVLEFQLQHQSFQWTPRTDLL